MTRLRHADKPFAEQRAALLDILRASPALMAAFRTARTFGRPDMHGVKDIDLFYYNPDTGYEAEDRIIQRAAPLFAKTSLIEIRNQGRIWPELEVIPWPH